MEEIKKSQIKPVQGIQICPYCGGSVGYAGISSGHIFPGIHTGQMYLCRECGYQGSFIMEVDSPDDVNKIKDAIKASDGNSEPPVFSYPEKWRWIWKIMLLFIITALLLRVSGVL